MSVNVCGHTSILHVHVGIPMLCFRTHKCIIKKSMCVCGNEVLPKSVCARRARARVQVPRACALMCFNKNGKVCLSKCVCGGGL